SIQRKTSGMKSARNSSRTMLSSPSMPCAESSSRRSSISSAIPKPLNPSPHSPTSSGHSDVEVVLVAALGAMLSAARAETPVERGGYLVNAVMACDGCHTPRPPGGAFDMSKRFSGGSQTWDTPQYLVKGSNISPDPETGIGKW